MRKIAQLLLYIVIFLQGTSGTEDIKTERERGPCLPMWSRDGRILACLLLLNILLSIREDKIYFFSIPPTPRFQPHGGVQQSFEERKQPPVNFICAIVWQREETC